MITFSQSLLQLQVADFEEVFECSTTDSLPRQDTSTSKRQRMGDSQSDHLEGSTICVESADFEETGSSYSAEV